MAALDPGCRSELKLCYPNGRLAVVDERVSRSLGRYQATNRVSSPLSLERIYTTNWSTNELAFVRRARKTQIFLSPMSPTAQKLALVPDNRSP